eukprot:3290096-Amphidinium_carterae.1
MHATNHKQMLTQLTSVHTNRLFDMSSDVSPQTELSHALSDIPSMSAVNKPSGIPRHYAAPQ